MNELTEPPKDFRTLFVWMRTTVAAGLAAGIIISFVPFTGIVSLAEDSVVTAILFAIAAAVAFGINKILHLLFRNHILQRALFVIVCFAALVVVFYAEEDWRGWHAWQKYKHEWEWRGE